MRLKTTIKLLTDCKVKYACGETVAVFDYKPGAFTSATIKSDAKDIAKIEKLRLKGVKG